MLNINPTLEELSQINEIAPPYSYDYKLNTTFRGLLLRCELCECVAPVREIDDGFICKVCENAWGGDLRQTIRATRAGADISDERFWSSLANSIIDELTGRKSRAVALLQTVVDEQKEAAPDEPK